MNLKDQNKIRSVANAGKIKPRPELWNTLDHSLSMHYKERKIKNLTRWVVSLGAASVLLGMFLFLETKQVSSDATYVYAIESSNNERIDNTPLYDLTKIKGLKNAYN